MRKAQKEQVESFIELLGQAHEAIEGYIATKETEMVLDLLGQCQDGAISLANFIESIEGNECATLSVLEGYCRLLYELYEKVNKNLDVNSEKKLLSDYLIRIRESVEADITVRKEVAFLPYKVSMWDSLESIWKAAEEDPACDAYVIPIPYYNRNPDGSFGKMCYEGEQYPDYVPITKYYEYDFENRRPDIIYIHNPYDDCNRVTCVLQCFYSRYLKNCTEKLIYVPYYIFPGVPKPGDRVFPLHPGVRNADYVFVQNEETRQFYLDTICGYMRNAEREVWEQKIIALGSPKTDKIITMQKDKMQMPSEWKRCLEGKKVIFFNTNISMLLNNPNHIIENLQRIFAVIKKHPEFAVIWREHPLTQATLNSMMPELEEHYRRVKEEFVALGIGVLDATEEPYLAMALSDCYYGAGGSLSAIYPVSGKPIMITDYLYPETISEEKITLEELLAGASKRMMYLERNRNALEVFLENMTFLETLKEEQICRQAIRMDNLDGTVGQKIYEYTR